MKKGNKKAKKEAKLFDRAFSDIVIAQQVMGSCEDAYHNYLSKMNQLDTNKIAYNIGSIPPPIPPMSSAFLSNSTSVKKNFPQIPGASQQYQMSVQPNIPAPTNNQQFPIYSANTALQNSSQYSPYQMPMRMSEISYGIPSNIAPIPQHQYQAIPASYQKTELSISKTPNDQNITIEEQEIIENVMKRDTGVILRILTKFNIGERSEFLRSYKYKGDLLFNILESYLDDKYKPMIIGNILGSSYYDCQLIKYAVEMNSPNILLTVICMCKLMKRKTPNHTFLECYSIKASDYIKNWKNKSSNICTMIYLKSRKKSEKFDNESIAADVKDIFRKLERKEESLLLEVFLRYSKSRMAEIAKVYHYVYGMTIYEHAIKCALDINFVLFLKNIIPILLNEHFFFAYILYEALFSLDYEISAPYLLNILPLIRKSEVITNFIKLSGKQLQESIDDRFSTVIAAFLKSRI